MVPVYVALWLLRTRGQRFSYMPRSMWRQSRWYIIIRIGCWTTRTRPYQILVPNGFILSFRNINKKRIRVQCFPLYSILLAVGTTKIDFFSLDVEGAEESVLDSLPMDKLDIGLFVIEYTHSNKTIKAERLERMRNFFSKVGGYKFHGTHKDMDAIFKKVKNGSWFEWEASGLEMWQLKVFVKRPYIFTVHV